MKKTIMWFILFTLSLSLLMAELQQPLEQPKDAAIRASRVNEITRNAPNLEFVVNPVDIIANFYDYMPGGYNRNPMILQPETTSTGYPAGGLYIGFHTKESVAASSQRRVYFAYINSAGELDQRSTVSTDNAWEGFPGTTIDPVTGDPFMAYHRSMPDNIYDCYLSYDLYHLIAAPGAWKTPFIAIDNPITSESYTGYATDQFIWPKVGIGPSPVEGKRRLYIYTDNSTNNSSGSALYNILIGKADFDGDMLANQLDLEFDFTTIPELDDLHYNNINRAIKDMVISDDGQVAFVGWHGHTFFIVYSSDFGETYTYLETNGRFNIEAPLTQLGGNEWFLANDDGSRPDMFLYPSGNGGHFNAFFTENNSKIVAISAFGLNTQETNNNNQYYPAFFYPKVYNYSIENGELFVHVIDLYIEGANPNDGVPMIPWDLDEDGEPDYDENGDLMIVNSVPTHYFNGVYADAFFHESNFKLSVNSNWVIAVWQDAEKVYMNYYEEPGFGEWAEKPEILIAVSGDYGVTWSQPAFMNAKVGDANYYPQLSGKIPVYVYPADRVEVIDDMHAKLHLFFMNDYSYGSYAGSPNAGANTGGMMHYAAINVEMPVAWINPVSSENNVLQPVKNAYLHNNYPNPFNPTTTIKFDLKISDKFVLEIFNVKGQKVATLVDEYLPTGTHEVVWNGKDDSNTPIASGVYFSRLRSGRYTSTKKMILMK
jgi:hypothetical protein